MWFLIGLLLALFIVAQPFAIEGERLIPWKWLVIAVRIYFFTGWAFIIGFILAVEL